MLSLSLTTCETKGQAVKNELYLVLHFPSTTVTTKLATTVKKKKEEKRYVRI